MMTNFFKKTSKLLIAAVLLCVSLSMVACQKTTDITWKETTTYMMFSKTLDYELKNRTEKDISNIEVTVYYNYRAILNEPRVDAETTITIKFIEADGTYKGQVNEPKAIAMGSIKKITYIDSNNNVIELTNKK